ncbi:MAG: hypothetical protein AAF989_14255 [Planctomycetota bacterium]
MSDDDSTVSDEAFELFERSIEGSLTENDADRLNRLVAEDADVRHAYLQYTHMHGCMHLHAVPTSEADNRDFAEASGPRTAPPVRPAPAAKSSKWPYAMMILAASVAFLLGRLEIWQDNAGDSSSETVAKLIESKGCTWGESSLPTVLHSQLQRGTIRLLSGMATLEFESGARVTLEGSVDLELIDTMNCVLHDGTLFARIPPRAQGFRVETDSAVLVDYGTEFGVVVNRDRQFTDVQVFSGVVDVQQRTTQKLERMLTGERSIIDKTRFERIDVDHDEIGESPTENATSEPDPEVIITSAEGRGRIGYIRYNKPRASVFDTRLIIKTSEQKPQYNSKGYIAFDLTAFGMQEVDHAVLQLHILPSFRGYASLVPDATFAVYGITNESLDDWEADALTWENGPANVEGGTADSDDATLVGRFVIRQGMDRGFATIEGQDLADFLNTDTNQIASFLIVRETSETDSRGLAHTFARGNPHEGIAPSLFLSTKQD